MIISKLCTGAALQREMKMNKKITQNFIIPELYILNYLHIFIFLLKNHLTFFLSSSMEIGRAHV